MTSIFLPPANVALLIRNENAGELGHVAEWHQLARSKGWLIISLHDIASEDGPWLGVAMPGAETGYRAIAHQEERRFTVHGDTDGLYLVSTIDLILRTHNVSHVVVIGDTTPNFSQNLRSFCKLQDYTIEFLKAGARPSPDLIDVPDAPGLPVPLALSARLAPEHVALVLIDVQNDFCAETGATGRGGQPITMIKGAVEKILDLLAAARAAGVFIVHVRAEYGAPFRAMNSPYRFPASEGREPAVWTASAADLANVGQFPNESVEVCLSGTWGANFVDGIEPRPGEAVVTKHRFGAFADTGLDRLLRAKGISSLVIAGVTTNCCVETTAREAVMRNFNLFVPSDCVAVKDHLIDLHRATLESLSLYFGRVCSSEEIMEKWRGM